MIRSLFRSMFSMFRARGSTPPLSTTSRPNHQNRLSPLDRTLIQHPFANPCRINTYKKHGVGGISLPLRPSENKPLRPYSSTTVRSILDRFEGPGGLNLLFPLFPVSKDLRVLFLSNPDLRTWAIVAPLVLLAGLGGSSLSAQSALMGPCPGDLGPVQNAENAVIEEIEVAGDALPPEVQERLIATLKQTRFRADIPWVNQAESVAESELLQSGHLVPRPEIDAHYLGESRGEKRFSLIVNAHSGTRLRLTGISFTTPNADEQVIFPETELRGFFDIADGEWADFGKICAGAEKLEQHYRRHGYEGISAVINPSTYTDTDAVSVELILFQERRRPDPSVAREDPGKLNPPYALGSGFEKSKLIKYVRPEWPLKAAAGQVLGVVEMRVTVGSDGRVLNAEAISGPQELEGVAVEAAKRWEFDPSGAQVSGVVKVTRPF